MQQIQQRSVTPIPPRGYIQDPDGNCSILKSALEQEYPRATTTTTPIHNAGKSPSTTQSTATALLHSHSVPHQMYALTPIPSTQSSTISSSSSSSALSSTSATKNGGSKLSSPLLLPSSPPLSPTKSALSSSSLSLASSLSRLPALLSTILVSFISLFCLIIILLFLHTFPSVTSSVAVFHPTPSSTSPSFSTINSLTSNSLTAIDYSNSAADGYLAPRMFGVVFMNRDVNQCDGGIFGTFDKANTASVNSMTFHELFRDYYKNVCMHNLHSTVFHDVPDEWVTEYHQQPFHHPLTDETYICDVIMQPVILPLSPLHTFDIRWLIYAEYLQTHHHRYLLFTDISDVRFDADPFVFIAAQTSKYQLFIGNDDNVPSEPNWFGPRYTGCQLNYQRYENTTSLNAGVIGGNYEAILWLTHQFTNAFTYMLQTRSVDKCLCLSTDMIILNSMLLDPTTENSTLTPRPVPYHWMQGEPFVGRYKDKERPSLIGEQFVRHKTVVHPAQ